MEFSKRMDLFGESIFTTLAKMRKEKQEQGEEVIDLSIGAPNIPPAPHIIQAISEACLDESQYLYAIRDSDELLKAVKDWYFQRYHVILDEKTEITSLLGSQEGLSHLAMTIVNDGDVVLVPNPSYPIFKDGPLLAGAHVVDMPLKKENGYMIDFSTIKEEDAKRAKLMVVSYPNNPTCGIANDKFYQELITFAKKYDIIVLHDNAYSELLFDHPGHSFLEYEGAKDVGIEFNSLSKTYCLAGARIGFAIGNSKIIEKIKTLKSNIDYGMFLPIQKGAIAAITGDQSCVEKTREAYRHRRDLLVDGCHKIGWIFDKPLGTMFVWAKIPSHYSSSEIFVQDLFDKTGVLVVPGNAFGSEGEGYVRMALVQDDDTINKALNKMANSHIFNSEQCDEK